MRNVQGSLNPSSFNLKQNQIRMPETMAWETNAMPRTRWNDIGEYACGRFLTLAMVKRRWCR